MGQTLAIMEMKVGILTPRSLFRQSRTFASQSGAQSTATQAVYRREHSCIEAAHMTHTLACKLSDNQNGDADTFCFRVDAMVCGLYLREDDRNAGAGDVGSADAAGRVAHQCGGEGGLLPHHHPS